MPVDGVLQGSYVPALEPVRDESGHASRGLPGALVAEQYLASLVLGMLSTPLITASLKSLSLREMPVLWLLVSRNPVGPGERLWFCI